MPDPQASFCCLRRDAALNWLAFGLLLAAWNAVDDVGVNGAGSGSASSGQRKPPELRGYAVVSVRAGKGHKTVNRL